MLLAILLQIATLLPPAPNFAAAPDSDYQKDIQKLASQETWTLSATDALAPQQLSHRATIASFLRQGTNAEVRLSAILGAGCDGDSPLGYAFWRRAAMEFEESKTIACLLAPATVPTDVLPMLAWISTDSQRSLPIRATALARLLDADQIQTWPLVHAMLLAGTTEDRVTSTANWNRGGRYELPKRILLLSVQALLKRHAIQATEFEPNAAWNLQLEQLHDLGKKVKGVSIPRLSGETLNASTWVQLLHLAQQKVAHAEQAQHLLLPSK